MKDIDNNSGYPEQDKEHTNEDISMQNTGQYSPSENGSTYWESSEWQEPYEASNQADITQADSNPDTNESAYNAFNNSQYELPKKKNGGKKVIAAAIIVVVLLAGAAAAYAFSGTIRNSVALLLKSPRDYYAHVENQSIGNSVDKMIAYMNMNSADKDKAASVSVNLSYDKDTVGAMLQSFMGININDLEAVIGIPLDSIGIDILAANKGKELYEKIGLNLNKIDIISAELFMDYAAEEMLIHLPDLSPAYLKQSLNMGEYTSDDFSLESLNEIMALLSSEKTGEFIKRYTALITDEIKDVKLTKGEILTVGDLDVKSNLLTIHLYPDTFTDIFTSVLEKARNDEYIIDLLPLFNISKEEFNSEIDEALKSVADMKDDPAYSSGDSDMIIMNIYVGNDGDILGREIEIHTIEGIHTIRYFNLEQDDKGAYEFYIKDDESAMNISVTGSHSIDKGAYTGSAVIDITSEEITQPQLSFNLEYKGIKSIIKNGRIYTYGNMTLSSYAMMGFEVVLEYDVKDEEQFAVFKLNMGRSSLVTLETSTKYLDDFTIPTPDENADRFDTLTQADAYYSTMDIQAYLSDLSDRLGIDLGGLLGSLLPIF